MKINRSEIGKIKSVLKWGFFQFFKNPRLEAYIFRMDRINRKYFDRVKEIQDRGVDDFSVTHPYRKIPRKIWIYWSQGYESSPFIVKLCISSWKKHNSDWEINVLDETSVKSYVPVSDIPNFLPLRVRADVLRLRILSKYGGVWADATSYCHRPLESWIHLLGHTGFFVFTNPASDRLLENWFIASSVENIITKKWEQTLYKYCVSLKFTPRAYFFAYYILQWRMKCSSRIGDEFRKCGSIPAALALHLGSYISGRTDYESVANLIVNGLPVSKLNWKIKIDEAEVSEKLSRVESLVLIDRDIHVD